MPRRQSWYKYQCRPLTPPKSQQTTSSTELRSAELNKFRPPLLWHVEQSTNAGRRSGRSSVPVHKALPRKLGRVVPVPDSLLLRSPGVRPDYEWREPHNVVCRSSCGENSVGQKQTEQEKQKKKENGREKTNHHGAEPTKFRSEQERRGTKWKFVRPGSKRSTREALGRTGTGAGLPSPSSPPWASRLRVARTTHRSLVVSLRSQAP